MTLPARVGLTVMAILIWGWLDFFIGTAGTLASAPLAGQQLANSDMGYITASYGTRLFSWFGAITTLGLVALLLALWWRKMRPGTSLTNLPVLMLVLSVMPAQAYFDTVDKTEGYFILPNESAFWIPDVGANKDSQGRFEGVDYLNANKVAAKRFIIPHAKLSNSGGNWGFDAYVPTGRLIIVDRTPYNREWTAPTTRGTSVKNESFPCQSSEGLNITVEVAIAASVLEENASRYLYYFGVKPPQGDRTANQVIFTSVFYGRTLVEVMDTVGRGEVQTLVCNEISSRTLDHVNEQASSILGGVQKNATAFFATRGITLDYIGWAGTFTFDADVQMAINHAYDAQKIGPYLDTLRTKAAIDAVARWDGRLPTTVSGLAILPPELLAAVTAYLSRPGSTKP